MSEQPQNGDMGKEDRMRLVLDILEDTQMALPPIVIFRNAKLRGATFERRSVNNYLAELAEEGYLQKVDPSSLDSGELREVSLSDEGYFVATDRASEFPE